MPIFLLKNCAYVMNNSLLFYYQNELKFISCKFVFGECFLMVGSHRRRNHIHKVADCLGACHKIKHTR